jgi:hypothetical protein
MSCSLNLFYIVQIQNALIIITHFSKAYYHKYTQFQASRLGVTSVTPISQVRASTMLLLPTTENSRAAYYIWIWPLS